MKINDMNRKSDLNSMGTKKKSWFTLVKRFFISDSQSKQEKKEKRRKWVFTRMKMRRLPSITAPPQKTYQDQEEEIKEKNVIETEEKQSSLAIPVPIASDEAESPEIIRITSTSRSVNWVSEESEKTVGVESRAEREIRCMIESRRVIQESSAMKIQTAFRGYLARKALRALKGIVTLQAIIRGRAVRRQAVTTLKRLQSIINIQSQVCANRLQQTAEGDYNREDGSQLSSFRDKLLRMDSYNQRRWDDSLLSKEEADAMFMSKKEAAIKRERVREYWHSHRKSAESERKQVSGRWRYWLEQWVDTQLMKSKELEDLDTRQRDYLGTKKLRIKTLKTQSEVFMDTPSLLGPRKQSHRRQCSLGDESSFASSPIVPTYMAATESARAKARSISSPKLRPESLDGFSPSKNKLSLVSSFASEVPISSNGMMGRNGESFHQRSPSLKGVRGPVKCSRKSKDLSFDSECSLSHWNQQSAFR